MLLNIISGLVVFVAGIIVYWNISFLFPSLHGENLENFKVMYLISFSYTVLYFPFKVFAGHSRRPSEIHCSRTYQHRFRHAGGGCLRTLPMVGI